MRICRPPLSSAPVLSAIRSCRSTLDLAEADLAREASNIDRLAALRQLEAAVTVLGRAIGEHRNTITLRQRSEPILAPAAVGHPTV